MTYIRKLYNNYAPIIKYLFFGALTTLVNVVTYSLCYNFFKIPNLPSTVIAWVIAVLFAFITNKLYVFNSDKRNKYAIKEAVSFFMSRIFTGIIEVAIMFVFVDLLSFNGTIMKIITNVVVIILNYIASKFIIFKK